MLLELPYNLAPREHYQEMQQAQMRHARVEERRAHSPGLQALAAVPDEGASAR